MSRVTVRRRNMCEARGVLSEVPVVVLQWLRVGRYAEDIEWVLLTVNAGVLIIRRENIKIGVNVEEDLTNVIVPLIKHMVCLSDDLNQLTLALIYHWCAVWVECVQMLPCSWFEQHNRINLWLEEQQQILKHLRLLTHEFWLLERNQTAELLGYFFKSNCFGLS